MSEETVKTLQAGRQPDGRPSLRYMGSSKDSEETQEGRIDVLALALSEAAIAKGKIGICKLEWDCTTLCYYKHHLVLSGQVEVLQSSLEEAGRQIKTLQG